MFNGFEFEVRPTRIFNLQLGDFVVAELPRLIDRRSTNVFHASLHKKADALIAILNSHKNQAGVVFSRKIRLSDAIFKRVVANGWNAIQVDSRFTDRIRDKRLNEFRDGKHNLLIIHKENRKTSQFPQAEFSIFYSPQVA